MSRSFLINHDFCMVFESDTVALTKSGLFVRKEYECGRMFKLSIMTIRPIMNNNNNFSAYMLESSNL